MEQSKLEENPFLRLVEELILEILYRVPVKSLGRCKLVCKSWFNLISDPEFAIAHLEFSSNNTQPSTIVIQKHNITSSLKFDDSTCIAEGVTLAPFEHQFLHDNVFDCRYCFIIGSSDGLICVYVKEMDDRRRGRDSLYLWNPCTTEDSEISLPIKGGSFYVHIDSSWFGCVPSSDDYIILLLYTVYKPSYNMCMFLYSLRYDRWRDICVSDEYLDLITGAESVFFNEALHYLVCRNWMVKFDLVTETFKRIPFSIKADLVPQYNEMVLGVIGEYDCLCVMFVNRSEEWMFELWTLEEYGKWDSWEKLYRIDLQEDVVRNCIQFLGFTYSGNLCIQQANGLVLIDPDDDPPSHVIARNPSLVKVYKVMDFVESLVSPDSIP
ncbi:hypothetical protein RDABS01_013350 [Bienertia sinuspersici]